MGYYSAVTGSVGMTEGDFKATMEITIKLPSFSEPQRLKDYFDEFYYEDGKCYINSYAKHYDLERIVEVLASNKTGDMPDEILYQGESGIEDTGTYFILPGKWAFISVQYPSLHDVKEGDWVKATKAVDQLGL
jgi:hypothetical protein